MTRRQLLRAGGALGLAMGTDPLFADEAPWPPPGAGAQEVPPRTPRYPLKRHRTLRTDDELATARKNIARYPVAKALADGIVRRAGEWLLWSEEELRWLITPARIPRAFDVGPTIGCPHCGDEIHQKFGTYPWKVDLKQPFRLTCPVDGTTYPTNDYSAYYRSGFTQKRGWDTAVVDDGWGWLNPKNGVRYWFVAHWNHRVWHYHLGSGVRTLGLAYQLTGDRRYAARAATMLHRMAQVYPAMDHERQSRYGLMMAQRGSRYVGKVLNRIWETGLSQEFAEAYDAVFETIDDASVRASIEANLLEEAVDAVFDGKIEGNFGMHQSALGHLAVVRECPDSAKWIQTLLRRTDGGYLHTGIDYALYNLVFRDGLPSETAPGYNFLWSQTLTELAALLQRGGIDLFARPRFAALHDAVLNQVAAGKFTPSLGDSGSVYGGLVGRNAEVYQTAYHATRRDRYRRFLQSFGATGEAGFISEGSLFRAPVPPTSAPVAPQKPRLLDGYGMAILNNPADTVGATLYYGLRGGHGHHDRLGIEIFAGQPMTPDLGYPDAMNDYVPGISTWSINTVCHNTVVVDATRQPGNLPGTALLFADSPFARVVVADGAGTYPQARTYRRTLLMVDVGEGSYFVDRFTVEGGRQHDYSLHGPPGAFTLQGGAWTDPAPGTLAGENVTVGQLYDDPVRGAPGYAGGYYGYQGSGFQHLTEVRRLARETSWFGEWRHEKDPAARIRIRVLPQPGQEIRLAHARVSPVQQPQRLTYVLAHRAGEDTASCFVAALEPYRETPLLKSVEATRAMGDETLLRAVRADGRIDWLFLADAPGERQNPLFFTDARVAVLTTDADETTVRRVFFADGTYLRIGRRSWKATPLSGTVTAVDPQKGTLRIRPDGAATARALAGRVAHFVRGARRVAHPLAAARRAGDELVLTVGDDLKIGRFPATQIEGAQLRTSLQIPLAPAYVGATLCDDRFAAFFPIESIGGGALYLATPPGERLRQGEDVWVIDVAPGDRFEMPGIASWKENNA